MEDQQPLAGYKYFPGSEDSAKVVQIVEHDKWVPSYSWQGVINYQNALAVRAVASEAGLRGRAFVCVSLVSFDIAV